MPNTFNENTFSTTYKDDYRDSDNYHRILFNSGRALQARELTQMQTIIQKELSRFGRNIFKEGSVVNPGGLDIDKEYEYVKLQSSASLVLYRKDILTAPNGVKAEVLEFVAQENNDPPTVYVKYISGGTATSGTTPIKFSAGQTLTNTSSQGGTSSVDVSTTATLSALGHSDTSAANVVGQGYQIAVNLGGYFIRDHFVQALPQTKIISKYSNTPTVNIGFIVTEDIVTVTDTNELYDNQLGTPNLTAPGADRYRIKLTLSYTDETGVDSSTNFVITNKIVNGVIQREIDQNTYNIIGDELALRTKEESGSYVVDNLDIKFKENPDDASTLTLEISPGIAYTNGYRVSKTASTNITVNRSQATTDVQENVNIPANFGNYVRVASNKGLPDVGVSDFETYGLFTDTMSNINLTGSKIGTAKVRSVETEGSNYKYYLFDVSMNSGQNFRNTRAIAADSNNGADLILENNIAVLKDAGNNNVFFDLPRTRPSDVGTSTSGLLDINLTVQRRFQDTTDGSGNVTLTVTGTETFVDTGLWIVARTDTGAIITPNSITGSGTNSVTIDTSVNSTAIEIIGYVSRGSNAKHRTKTLSLDSDHTGVIESDGAGLRFVTLPNIDIHKFKHILDADSVDISARVFTDNGQRDNFYQKGRVILKGGQSLPTNETIRTVYNHFEHGATGDFFSRNSYIGAVDYEDIPSHRLANGFDVELRDVLDFRSVKDSVSSGFDGGRAIIHALPRNTDVITTDIKYYKSRKDILVATEDPDNPVVYIEGTPQLTPQSPVVPNSTMKLYDIALNPYTDNEDDLSVSVIDNRRYTMRDIGNIEKRINNLEEVVTLSMLELETSSLEVLDSNGNNRFKNGFFADNFKDLTFSDIFSNDYRASHNDRENSIMPSVGAKNVRLLYDSDGSTNTVRKGDNVYLNYSEIIEINQNLATGIENINPFDVILYNGTLILSPSVDAWREESIRERPRPNQARRDRDRNRNPRRRRNRARLLRRPIRVAVDPNRVNADNPNNPNSLESFGDISVGDVIDVPRQIVSRGSTRSSRIEGFRILGNGRQITTTTTTVRTLVGRRVISISLLPFIRHRKVFFRGTELAPDRQHFLFFDDNDITGYAREETFQRFGDGNGLVSYTDGSFADVNSHPQGAGTLRTDANGTVEGSFFLPNNDTLRFDAGRKIVKLTDIQSANQAAAMSFAAASYEAEGVRVVFQDITTSSTNTRVTTTPFNFPRDPIAQSFQVSNTAGAFITSIDVYFASVDSDVPVRLELRPVRSGVPSQDEIVTGGVVVKQGSEITNVTPLSEAVAAGEGGMGLIRSRPTKFEFDAPVYIPGNAEHAFVLIANTQGYNVYVAEIEDFLVGSNNRRVRKQPTLGSFFMSQNAITWTPDQRRDMMFRLRRAEFETSGSALFDNDAVPTAMLPNSPIELTAADSDVTVFMPNHGFTINDKVELTGLDSSTLYGDLTGVSLLGERTITKVDAFGYQFKADSAPARNAFVGGDQVVSEQQAIMDEVTPNLDVFSLEPTTANFSASFTDFVSLTKANLTTNTAYGTFADADIIPNSTILFNDPRIIASERVEGDEATLGGASTPRKSVEITGSLSTRDTYVSPVIDLQTASLTTVNNIVDNPVDSDGAEGVNDTTNVPIAYVAETDPDGTSPAKHVTNPISLAEPAVGLKVLIGVNVPTGSFIDLYFRTTEPGADVDMDDVNYTKATIDNEMATTDNPNIFREHVYTIGGLGGTLTPFTNFQLKIVFRAQNSSRVPRIKDLRAIALGT